MSTAFDRLYKPAAATSLAASRARSPSTLSTGRLAGPVVQRQETQEEKAGKEPSLGVTAGIEPKKADPKKSLKVKGEVERGGKVEVADKTKEKEGKTEEETTVKPESSFSFKTTVAIPILPGATLGKFVFLDDLELIAKASRKSEEPIGLAHTQLDDLDTQLALKLVQLRLSSLTGASLGLSTGLKPSFGAEPSTERTLGSSGTLKAGVEPDLGFGKLKLSGTTTFTASLTEVMGAQPDTKTSLGAKATGGVSFASRPFDVLGAESRLSVGATGTAGATRAESSSTGVTESTSLGLGGELGLASKLGDKSELTIKLTLQGDIKRSVDQDKVISTTRSQTLGIGTSISF